MNRKLQNSGRMVNVLPGFFNDRNYSDINQGEQKKNYLDFCKYLTKFVTKDCKTCGKYIFLWTKPESSAKYKLSIKLKLLRKYRKHPDMP